MNASASTKLVAAMDADSAVEQAAEQKASRNVRRALVVAVVMGFAVLITASALTVVLVARGREYTHWVNHTYEVERQISELNVLLERSEAVQRAFLVTGEPRYLETYSASVDRIPPVIDTVGRLTIDNPVQIRNVALLRQRMQALLDRQRTALADARTAGQGSVDPATLIHANQDLLDRTRQVATAMVAEETQLLARRTGRQQDNGEALLAVVLLSGLFLAAIALAAFLAMRRYAADLGRSQAALRTLNEGLEDAVRMRTADLTRANEEIQRFAYIVSHDLRAPLVNVMGFTSELEVALKSLHELTARVEAQAPQLMRPEARAAVEQDLPESIGFIRSSTQKMDRLINAILRLSREGRRVLNAERLDMVALMTGITDSLQQQAETRGADIEVSPALPDLQGDRLATEQVFSNLVENALKYLKPGRPGRIVVRGAPAGAMMVYEVQDNGRGIDAKDHERVFELFRRAGAQDQPGEGIGLAHVRALVTRMGGNIELQSALDAGTTFRISLPRAAPSS